MGEVTRLLYTTIQQREFSKYKKCMRGSIHLNLQAMLYIIIPYLPATPHTPFGNGVPLLGNGVPLPGKHANGIFNALPASLIRAISNGPGGL